MEIKHHEEGAIDIEGDLDADMFMAAVQEIKKVGDTVILITLCPTDAAMLISGSKALEIALSRGNGHIYLQNYILKLDEGIPPGCGTVKGEVRKVWLEFPPGKGRKLTQKGFRKRFFADETLTPQEQRVETLAAKYHEIWSAEMKATLGQNIDLTGGHIKIPEEKFWKWHRRMYTPYDQLPEEKREANRELVRKYGLDKLWRKEEL